MSSTCWRSPTRSAAALTEPDGWSGRARSAAGSSPRPTSATPTTAWERLPRVGQLDPRSRAVARELAAWRERTAAAADRPVGSIVADPALVELAKRKPSNPQGLEQIRGLHPPVIKRRGEAILEAIARGREAEPIAREEARGRSEPGDAPLIALVESLLRARALEAGLAYELIAARAELEQIVGAAAPARPRAAGAHAAGVALGAGRRRSAGAAGRAAGALGRGRAAAGCARRLSSTTRSLPRRVNAARHREGPPAYPSPGTTSIDSAVRARRRLVPQLRHDRRRAVQVALSDRHQVGRGGPVGDPAAPARRGRRRLTRDLSSARAPAGVGERRALGGHQRRLTAPRGGARGDDDELTAAEAMVAVVAQCDVRDDPQMGGQGRRTARARTRGAACRERERGGAEQSRGKPPGELHAASR